MFDPDNYLMLSGIQHYVFCPHQWAMIHIEQIWDDNRLTAEGQIMHNNADNPAYRQKNGDLITLRRVAVASASLGLYGFSDAVELIPSATSEQSVMHPSYPGYWRLHPIEYKHGRPKPDLRDKVQVVAQAICLEEIFQTVISECSIYYGDSNSRITFEIDNEIRAFTVECAIEMHRIFDAGIIPVPIYKPHCRNCSLFNECMPKTPSQTAVNNYLKTNLYEETS